MRRKGAGIAEIDQTRRRHEVRLLEQDFHATRQPECRRGTTAIGGQLHWSAKLLMRLASRSASPPRAANRNAPPSHQLISRPSLRQDHPPRTVLSLLLDTFGLCAGLLGQSGAFLLAT